MTLVFEEEFMIEEWRDIKDYEGLYLISNTGKVVSQERDVSFINGQVRHYKERVLKQTQDGAGYRYVTLCKTRKGYKRFLVHRLVAQAFLPNPYNLPQINHKDECKQNNNVDNLEWCDSKYNNNYNGKNTRTGRKVYLEKGNERICFDTLKQASDYINYSVGSLCNSVDTHHKCRGYLVKSFKEVTWYTSEDT